MDKWDCLLSEKALLKQIAFWESEADAAEEELEHATSQCRHYYKLLDVLKENDDS